MSYVCLHSHSSYSYDGIGSIEDWVLTAKKIGLKGLSITDHGNCSSALELFYYGKKHDFPIIMGEEFYIIEDPFKKDKTNRYYHITVWVKNNEGYKSLCRLSSLGFESNRFYYKPRIGFDDLFTYRDGLMVGSGCIVGPLCKNILNNDESIAREYVQLFKKEFKDDYYLEIQPSIIDEKAREAMKERGLHSVNPQEEANRQIVEYGKMYDIRVVATPDAHMPLLKHQKYHDLKLSLQTGGGFDFEQPYYLYSGDEIKNKFYYNHSYLSRDDVEKSLLNTIDVLNKASGVKFDLKNPYGIFGPLLPDYKIEDHKLYKDGDTIDVLTYRIIMDNGRVDLSNRIYRSRLSHEIEVLASNGSINFLSYFLTLEDVIRFCAENNILHGIGRGSGGGCLLGYAIGLTSIDPIEHDLMFSRFINKARIKKGTLPDYDLDFSDPERVKEYITEKYGSDKVYSMSTVMTFKLKSAFKDIVKVKKPEMTFAQANKYTQGLPAQPEGMGEVDYMDYCIEQCPSFSSFLEENNDIRDMLQYIMGQQRQRGKHACALSISPIPLNDIIPTFVNKETHLTQYDYKWCERIGVVKFDILGLNTLNDVQNCVKFIKDRHGINIDIHSKCDINYNDKSIYNEFKNGNTKTVFQFNSDVSRSILMKLDSIDSINDLAIVTALGRPSTMQMGMHIQYIDRKNMVVPTSYPHHSLESVLGETFGVITYQEQVMRACQILAGFNEEESDDVRRAMGKKKKDVMDVYSVRFVDGAMKRHNVSRHDAKSLWDLLESFTGYGFCKAHAVAYAKTGYICMYFKKYYPLEWWCAVLKNHGKDKLVEYYSHVKDNLVMPNIVDSGSDYYINSNNKIVIPLSFVKKVGGKVLDEIIEQRKYRKFNSFHDFHSRVKRRIVRVDVMENLIFAGVFSQLHPDMTTYDLIVELYKIRKQVIPKKFHHMNNLKMVKLEEECIPIRPVDYISMFKDMIGDRAIQYGDLYRVGSGTTVVTAGVVTDVKFLKTAKGKDMAFVSLRNGDENLSLTCWDSVIKDSKVFMKKGTFLKVKGKVNRYKGKTGVVPVSIEYLA